MIFRIIYFIVFFWNAQMFSQNNLNFTYEEVALNYFFDEIVNRNHSNVKYFYFNGNLEDDSPIASSFCLHPFDLKEKPILSNLEYKEIPIPKDKNVFKKRGFLHKLFKPKSKSAAIYLYKHFTLNDQMVVLIFVLTKGKSYFYNIAIDKSKKDIITHCKYIYNE